MSSPSPQDWRNVIDHKNECVRKAIKETVEACKERLSDCLGKDGVRHYSLNQELDQILEAMLGEVK